MAARGYSGGKPSAEMGPPAPVPSTVAAKRTCDVCNGAVPDRMARTRDEHGRLVCDGCKGMNMPEWATTKTPTRTPGELGYMRSLNALGDQGQAEMRRREAEALTSILRVRTGRRVISHDSGDQAICHHCPFCGSGAVTGGSDGSIDCEFCHTVFTVQVQPAHPNMPQTIDGQPVTPPGMPGGEETELSAPSDPAVEEAEEGVAENPLDGPAQDPEPPAEDEEESAPGQPPSKQPPWLKNKSSRMASDPNSREEHPYPDMGEYVVIADAIRRLIRAGLFSTYEEARRSGVVDRLHVDGIQSNLTTEQKVQEVLSSHDKQSSKISADRKFFTADGDVLTGDRYLAHLAISHADDKRAVLTQVREGNRKR